MLAEVAGRLRRYADAEALLDLAVREVFGRMLGCTLEMADPTIPREAMSVTAMVGLAGQLRGVMALRCSVRSARLMASKMLGTEVSASGPIVWDAVGEICNIVAGNFKNKIDGLGDGCMLSIPSVIVGADYDLHGLSDQDAIHRSWILEGTRLDISLQVHN